MCQEVVGDKSWAGLCWWGGVTPHAHVIAINHWLCEREGKQQGREQRTGQVCGLNSQAKMEPCLEYLKGSFFVPLKYYILLLLFLHSSHLWDNFLAHWQANFLFMIAKGVSCARPKEPAL